MRLLLTLSAIGIMQLTQTLVLCEMLDGAVNHMRASCVTKPDCATTKDVKHIMNDAFADPKQYIKEESY